MILKFKEWLLDPHRRVSVHKLRVKYFVTCYNFRDYFFIVTLLGRNVRFIFCFSLFLFRNCIYLPFINERESRVSTITIFFSGDKEKRNGANSIFFKFRKTNAPIYIWFWIHNSSKYFWKNCINIYGILTAINLEWYSVICGLTIVWMKTYPLRLKGQYVCLWI